jgi:hypothetical protein
MFKITAPAASSLAVIMVLALCIFGCSNSTAPESAEPANRLIAASGCGGFSETKRAEIGIASVPTSDQTCLVWEYDQSASRLTVSHLNGAFNCCTQPNGAVNTGSSHLWIIEFETGPVCRCLCLYDLQFEIHDISPQTYTLAIISDYTPTGDQPITTEIDLESQLSGMICFDRTGYPWAEE